MKETADASMSIEKVCTRDKEQIKMALKGLLKDPNSSDEIRYLPASKEDCEKAILKAYDECAFNAICATVVNQAYEEYLKEKGIEFDENLFFRIVQMVDMKYWGKSKYQFETPEEIVKYQSNTCD